MYAVIFVPLWMYFDKKSYSFDLKDGTFGKLIRWCFLLQRMICDARGRVYIQNPSGRSVIGTADPLSSFESQYHLALQNGNRCGVFKCPSCGKAFMSSTGLRTHTMVHTGERPYKCKLCGEGFIQNIQLTLHVRKHTGEKPFACVSCGMRFSHKSNYNRHLKSKCRAWKKVPLPLKWKNFATCVFY
jgi:uncharacterized Zn-finger protein